MEIQVLDWDIVFVPIVFNLAITAHFPGSLKDCSNYIIERRLCEQLSPLVYMYISVLLNILSEVLTSIYSSISHSIGLWTLQTHYCFLYV